MKVLAFPGSSSKNSINKKFIEYIVKSFSNDEVEILDLNHYEMPIYSIDKELESGLPALAKEFAEKIDQSDLLIISLAEHNSAYTTAFKNVFDWISRVPGRKHFGEKPVFLTATATGPGGGKHVLAAFEARSPFSGANVLQSFSLPKFNDFFDEEKGIVDADKKKEFEEKLIAVKNFFA